MSDDYRAMDAGIDGGSMDASVAPIPPPVAPPPPAPASRGPTAQADGTSSTASAPFAGMYDPAAGICGGSPTSDNRLPGYVPHAGSTGSMMISAYDANLRITRYVEPARELAQRAWNDYQAGNMTHLEARDMASGGRTRLLQETRRELSPGARAMSEAIREEGHSIEDMTRRYALRLLEEDAAVRTRYGVTAVQAGRPEVEAAVRELQNSEAVSQRVIQAAGRSNPIMTPAARTIRVIAPVIAATGAVASTYEVVTAERGQHAWTAGREGASFAGGSLGSMAGGLAAGWTASLLCGPGAPVCALVVSIVVGGAGAYAGSRAAQAGYEAAVPRTAFSALPDAEDVITAVPAAAAGPTNAMAASGGFSGAMHRDQAALWQQLHAPAPPRRPDRSSGGSNDRSSGGEAYIPSVDPNPGPTCGGPAVVSSAPEPLVCQ